MNGNCPTLYLAKIVNRSSSGDRTTASFQSVLCKEPNSNLHCRNFRDTICRSNLIQSLLLAIFGALFRNFEYLPTLKLYIC